MKNSADLDVEVEIVEFEHVPSSEPHWLDGVDAAERAELQAVGIDIQDAPTDAKADSTAGWLLRRLREVEENLSRYEAAEQEEKDQIGRRYANIVKPLVRAREAFAKALLTIAANAKFPGKSKSRKVAFGVYGRRTKKGVVQLADIESDAIDELSKVAPKAVTIFHPISLAELEALEACVNAADATHGVRAAVEVANAALARVRSSKWHVSKIVAKDLLQNGVELKTVRVTPDEEVPYFNLD